MENVVSRIRLFHALFLAGLAGTSVSFLFSIFLFFYLDIRGVIELFTGKGAKKEILKIDAEGIWKAYEEEPTTVLRMAQKPFYVEREIIFIHTDEIIELYKGEGK